MAEAGPVVQRRLARLVDGEQGVTLLMELSQHLEVAQAGGLQNALCRLFKNLKKNRDKKHRSIWSISLCHSFAEYIT